MGDDDRDETPIAFTQEELEEARRYSLVIEWSPRDDAFLVRVPEIPGLQTHGATHEEAVEMGLEAIAVWLDGLRATGQPVPEPRYAAASA
jgi:predicted RNase H-like HicB family nuclease